MLKSFFFCSKHDIAAQSFQIHEAHCHRHIVLCSTCGEPVPRTQLEEHFEENHIEAPCNLCGQRMAKDQLDEHKVCMYVCMCVCVCVCV